MEESFSLRLIALFVTLIASLCGVFLPLYFGRDFTPEAMKSHVGFCLIRSFSAGIMFGVAFIHLLAEAVEHVSDLVPRYPSLPYTLATGGLFFVLALENIVLSSVKPSHAPLAREGPFQGIKSDEETPKDEEDAIHSSHHTHTHNYASQSPPVQDCDGKLCKDIAAVGQDMVAASAAVKFHQKDVPAITACKHSHTSASVSLLADSRGAVVLLKAYVMEMAIAAHSVIIGVSMGMMGDDETVTLRALVIAMTFHQFFEGIGLGSVFSSLRLKLGTVKVAIFSFLFATTLSVGICIGIAVASWQVSYDEDTHHLVTGCCEAIAAGTLVYVSLVEMLAEEFSSSELESRHAQKQGMVVSFGLGVLVMALLALGEADGHGGHGMAEHDHDGHDADHHNETISALFKAVWKI